MDLKSTMPQESAWCAGFVSFFSMFTRPLVTLASLREHPRWLCPVLFCGVFSVAVNFYVIQQVGFVRLLNAAVRANTVIDTQGALQNALSHKAEILSFQALATFASSILLALVVAKVLWLLLTLFGHDVLFKSILAVVAHANLPPTLLKECMLALTATIIRDANTLDLANPLATNPAFFIRSASPVVSRILISLDVITAMNIVLIVAGLHRVCSRLSVRSATLAVLIPWAVYVGATLLILSSSAS